MQQPIGKHIYIKERIRGKDATMVCFRCGKNSRISLKHIGNMCNGCFLKIIEKRVRKDIRTKKLIRKNDRILMINNSSKEFFVSGFLLRKIIKELPASIAIRKSKKLNIGQAIAKKYDKIIVPWSLDDETEGFLGYLFNKEKQQKFSKKTIKLLKNVSEEEIALFAKIKKFRYRQGKKSKIKKMLDMLEQRYPGYKFSLLNSIKQMGS